MCSECYARREKGVTSFRYNNIEKKLARVRHGQVASPDVSQLCEINQQFDTDIEANRSRTRCSRSQICLTPKDMMILKNTCNRHSPSWIGLVAPASRYQRLSGTFVTKSSTSLNCLSRSEAISEHTRDASQGKTYLHSPSSVWPTAMSQSSRNWRHDH
jgi:hypothetical protein